MKILITGGGTGGHINPALAIGGYLKKLHHDWEIAYVGDPDKMEGRLIPAAGFRLYPIKMDGLSRSLSGGGLVHNLKTLKTASKALGDADRIITEFQPDLCIGVGGFVSWPVIRQAQKRKIKTMIHEQNAFPGVTTKLLSKRADVVLLPNAKAGERLPKAKYKVVVGNPVRDEFVYGERAAAREKLGLTEEQILVVSAGGSLGARTLNRTMADFLALSITMDKYVFVHGTGRGSYEGFCDSLREKHVKFNSDGRITVMEFINDMPTYMLAADLMISRAGASTLAELAVCGTPSILIPSPNVTENHQYHNAKVVEAAGGAAVITEDELTAQLLYDTVKKLTASPEKAAQMRTGATKLAIYDVCDRIYSEIKKLTGC